MGTLPEIQMGEIMPLGALSVLKKGLLVPELHDELPMLRMLNEKTEELVHFLGTIGEAPDNYEEVEKALIAFKPVTQGVDREFQNDQKLLGKIREGFRRNSAEVILKSKLFRSVRTWQEGYPADYLTLESIYNNSPLTVTG